MKIDHVCIAVRSIETAAQRLGRLFGYEVATDKVHNSRQDVLVQFLKKTGSLDIKLIEPGSKDSNLISFLKKGEGLHHLCFKTDDLDQSIEWMLDNRARLIAESEPGEAFDDEKIAFIYAGFGLNVELIDTDKRRGLKDKWTDLE